MYDDLALFTVVARHLSFAGAAREMNIPASRVSRHIADLEEKLGYTLFERTTRQVRLTYEGRILLDRCDGPMEALQKALRPQTGEGAKGAIRITAPTVAAKRTVGPVLMQFLEKYPDIQVDLIATNDKLDFIRDNIDLAFRLGPLPSSDLVARKLWRLNYSLCAHVDFLTHHGIADDLTQDALLTLPRIYTGLPWRFLEETSFGKGPWLHQFDDLEVGQLALSKAFGIGFMPEDMIEYPLIPLTIKGLTPMSRDLYCVYPSRRLLPQRLRYLIDWMVGQSH